MQLAVIATRLETSRKLYAAYRWHTFQTANSMRRVRLTHTRNVLMVLPLLRYISQQLSVS
jgi:hypothetical protein